MNIIGTDTNICGIQFFLHVFVKIDIKKKAAEPDVSSLNTNNNQV